MASDICQQGICTPSDLETVVTLGLHPMGPLAMGNHYSPTNVLEVLSTCKQSMATSATARPVATARNQCEFDARGNLTWQAL
jgi:3-hydroxyacyl-CoA dehydrogenase